VSAVALLPSPSPCGLPRAIRLSCTPPASGDVGDAAERVPSVAEVAAPVARRRLRFCWAPAARSRRSAPHMASQGTTCGRTGRRGAWVVAAAPVLHDPQPGRVAVDDGCPRRRSSAARHRSLGFAVPRRSLLGKRRPGVVQRTPMLTNPVVGSVTTRLSPGSRRRRGSR